MVTFLTVSSEYELRAWSTRGSETTETSAREQMSRFTHFDFADGRRLSPHSDSGSRIVQGVGYTLGHMRICKNVLHAPGTTRQRYEWAKAIKEC
jgi:hypothetical protein